MTESIEEDLAPPQGVESYEFAPANDPQGGAVVLSANGAPVLRATPHLATAEAVAFRRASMLRARGTIALVVLVLVFLAYAWREGAPTQRLPARR